MSFIPPTLNLVVEVRTCLRHGDAPHTLPNYNHGEADNYRGGRVYVGLPIRKEIGRYEGFKEGDSVRLLVALAISEKE